MESKLINIAIFTTTRAEFGAFSALLREIDKSEGIKYSLFVGGTHLVAEYGRTIQEIENLGFKISGTFDFLLNGDNSASLAKSAAKASLETAGIFEKYNFDYVCLIGDRFELLPIVTNAILFQKPIIHIHGGETTEGAIDEQIRHMLTKAAHLHFAACEEYAENIKRLGEPSWRVFNTGALSVDNIVNNQKINKKELYKELGLEAEKPTAILTYHPVTLEFGIEPEEQINNIFGALEKYDIQLVITAPNIDIDRNKIVSAIKANIKGNDRYRYVESLGVIRYHSLIPYCAFVIGNSSSGLLEVPYFKIPTINIGDRQKGRIRHRSVIDADYSVESIRKAIDIAMDEEFRRNLKNMEFKFGNGTAARQIVEIIKKTKIDQNFLRKRLTFPE